ncbi:MAG: GDP-mannose 4,6-dehydratase [Acidobacteriaceae bacterium]|nr:GDP-mannose 4,6-dehydratase [Acidobacteriaceae bacterium]
MLSSQEGRPKPVPLRTEPSLSRRTETLTRRALITGISGQDGSYLSEFLLERGYEVHGMVRRAAIEDQEARLSRILHLLDKVKLHAGALESFSGVFQVIDAVRPDEIYHLAAQSFVRHSFEDEFSTMNINVNGTHHVLAAARQLVPRARVYFAGSSEMIGKSDVVPQNESTPFHPRSPYGISKVAGYHLTRNYREAYGMFACTGILYNHESPRRGLEFVTRKITSQAVKIKLGLANEITLGNLDAMRDWGHAAEYVRAMWLMLQQDKPDDYLIATGETHSVREFLESAFHTLDLDPYEYLKIDAKFVRPAEVDLLRGDSSKARKQLGWTHEVHFHDLVAEMIRADLDFYSRSPGVTRAPEVSEQPH